MNDNSNKFVNLHVHTDGSLLDGLTMTSEGVNRVVELGQNHIGISDHGNLLNAYELYKEVQKRKAEGVDLNAVIGIEAYVAPSHVTRHHHAPAFFADGGPDDVSAKGSYTHMLLFAKNNEGLKALFKLNYLSFKEGYYKKNRMDIDLIREHAADLIGTTGCPSGEIQTKLRLGLRDEALEHARMMQEIFGKDDYYMELMDHDMSIELERKVEADLLWIAKELDIPLLATADSHYTHPDQAFVHENMLCISTYSMMSVPKTVEEGEGGRTRFAFDGTGYHLNSYDEMIAKFPDSKYPNAVTNTVKLAEKCNVTLDYKDGLRPSVPLPDGMTEEEYLRSQAMEGFHRRLPADQAASKKYVDQISYELDIIIEKGYSGYFLVVSDFLRWAKRAGIRVGPGRGSAAGSLLAYCLDITDAEPLRHGLIFARFINPERDSPPDIDIDFDDTRRAEVIKYVEEMYGAEYVSHVMTYGRIKAKNAVKDVLRIYDHPFGTGEALTKSMPEPIFGKGMSLKDMYDPASARYEEAEEFRSLVKEFGVEKEIEISLGLENRTRSIGTHACAIIISKNPIVETVPMMVQRKKAGKVTQETFQTQWDYPACEDLGLLKMDFLGLRNLSILESAVKLVKKRHGIDLDLTALGEGPMDDKATYKLLQSGHTLGVFQLDGDKMRDLLRLMKPTSFDDISAVLALYRPGPMGVNAHTDYALRKNGIQEVNYMHPELTEVLKPILAETYGLCLTGDSMIWDASSGARVRLDSLEGKVFSDEGFYTFSVNETTGKVERKRVTDWARTGVKDILNITTQDAKNVRVSHDHPVYTIDGWKDARDLVVGDYVATPGQPLEPTVTADEMTEKEAEFLGYLLGDGYLNFYQNTFTNSDNTMVEHVSTLAHDLFDDMHTHVYERERDGKFYTNQLWFVANEYGTGRGKGVSGVYKTTFGMNQWLRDLFPGNDHDNTLNSYNKYVPEKVFQSSNKVVTQVIKGLWDTDGHVSSNFAYLRTISKRLATDTIDMLQRLGIHAQLVRSSEYVSKNHGTVVPYGVYVYDPLFWEQIVPLLVSQNKNDIQCSTNISRLKNKRVSMSVFKKDMAEYIASAKPGYLSAKVITNAVAGKVTMTASSIVLDQESEGTVSQAVRQAVHNESKNISDDLTFYLEHYSSEENIRNSQLSWTQIKSITDEPAEQTYDITVEDNHNYFANNILVSNCVYQEQIMKIAQEVGGYSLGQADLLRRAMGKKKKSEMDAQWERFSEGGMEKGYSKEALQKLWDTIVPFADYAFNKAHSVAYGMISYMTAYMKVHYRVEYMAALLSSVSDEKDKTAVYLDDARQLGVKILTPDVSTSYADYTPISGTGVNDEQAIRFGLKAIRGVGEQIANTISDEHDANGPFQSFNELLNRLPTKSVNRKVFEALAYGGALDSLNITRKSVIDSLDHVFAEYQKRSRSKKKSEEKKEQMGGDLFDMFAQLDEAIKKEFDEAEKESIPEYKLYPSAEFSNLEKLKLEREYLGMYVSGHPLDGLNFNSVPEQLTSAEACTSDRVIVVTGFPKRGQEPIVSLGGMVSQYAMRMSKAGKAWASGKLEDRSGVIEFVIFGKAVQEVGKLIRSEEMYVLTGYPQRREPGGPVSLVVTGARSLEFGKTGVLPVRFKLTVDQWFAGERELLLTLQNFEAVGADADRGADVIVSIRELDGSVSEETIPFKVVPSTLMTQTVRKLFGSGAIGRWRPRPVPEQAPEE